MHGFKAVRRVGLHADGVGEICQDSRGSLRVDVTVQGIVVRGHGFYNGYYGSQMCVLHVGLI